MTNAEKMKEKIEKMADVKMSEEERWRAHVQKQNDEYDQYARNQDANTLDTSDVLAARSKPTKYSDKLLEAPLTGGLIAEKEHEELVRKREKMEKKEKKKKKKEKKDGKDSPREEGTPRLEGDTESKEKRDWTAELEWRRFLFIVRDMIKSSPDKRLQLVKFETHYGSVTKTQKLRYPFQGAADSWSLHLWLSREAGVCVYSEDWKEMTVPADDTMWENRRKNDPYFFVVEEQRTLEQTLEKQIENRELLNKQKMGHQKKLRELEQQVTNAKKAFSLQHGEQNRSMVQKCEQNLAQMKKTLTDCGQQMDDTSEEIKELKKKIEKCNRYRTFDELLAEKEKRSKESGSKSSFFPQPVADETSVFMGGDSAFTVEGNNQSDSDVPMSETNTPAGKKTEVADAIAAEEDFM